MKRYLLIFWLLSASMIYGQAPGKLSLDYCYQKAMANFPLIKQRQLLKDAGQLKIKTLNNTFLPQAFINGQATYQSDVTSLPIKLPNVNIEGLSKDQYKVSLDLSQTIYDGGNVSKQKKLENLSVETDEQTLDAELYKLKDRVNQLYFGIILIQESEKQVDVIKKDVENKLAKIESGVKNGIMLESNADVLNAEIIKLDQQLIEFSENKKSCFKMLAELMGEAINETPVLDLPADPEIASSFENKRLEMKIFDLQLKKTDVLKDMVSVKTMPRFSAFGQAGYGRPGLNMLKNEFKEYYMVGAKVSWNIWNWNQNHTDRKIIDIQKDIINSQKDIFEKNLKISAEKQMGDIRKLQSLIEKDSELIELRNKIVKTYSSQLDNGIITSTEYLTEVNNQLQARLIMESHKIQLIQAKINYLTLTGIY
jgi:Outer membrane protein